MIPMHVCSIVGARPNFIKLAALSPEIRKVAKETIIHTGQHYDYDMDKIFFEELEIPNPNYHLGVGSNSHGKQTGNMLFCIEETLQKLQPDAVIVFGDTNTTLAGALAAVKMQIPVIHIEAGLRSYDRTMPEEINRVLVDDISDWLFCPTKRVSESVWWSEDQRVYSDGDVIVDLINRKKPERIIPCDYYLLTIHRAENDNLDKLAEIFLGLSEIKDTIVFPCHPRMRKHIPVLRLPENVKVIDPVGFFQMQNLEHFATKIITDSGGLQKEAYLHGVPCISLRTTTEWVETLRGNWNCLAGSNSARIKQALAIIPDTETRCPEIFGRPGTVCRDIASHIVGG